MSPGVVRKVAILEPVTVFAMIMAYIWEVRYTHHGWWMAILAIMLLSHLLHRERASALGFRASGLRECWREFAPLLALFTLMMIAGGILLQSLRPVAFDRAVLSWMAYVPWGVFQQYLLNGYFLNRFNAVLSRRAAPLLAATLFSGAHVPNWFLMAVTLLAGYCCARIYRRYQNLWFLGAAHGTIGFLLFLVVPDSVTHHLTVGPGWFLH
ncbi:MAG TPA: CPBP family intramembrane glutamic endopeptidase [Bryobacteraceae bacterium]|nr:CPBP family intramembrane glutamic endopeptidase [Bryobacteraceae bacterium]